MTDNELIAKWMGYILNPHDSGNTFSKSEDIYTEGNDVYGEWHPINVFGSSWDWLMPVVDRIKSKYVTCGDISQKGHNYYRAVLDSPITVSIEILYQRIVRLIKWHNLQKE